ncbi:hypothetical protein BC940DRAFT_175940 [Gongronella butleri]|nr:hypothetical protein BC940DRAFT_175940 [Gongronella butleri]
MVYGYDGQSGPLGAPDDDKARRLQALRKAIHEQQVLLASPMQGSHGQRSEDDDAEAIAYLQRRIVEVSQQIKEQQQSTISSNGYTTRQWWTRFQTNKRQLKDLAQQRRVLVDDMDYMRTAITDLLARLEDENKHWVRVQGDFRRQQQQQQQQASRTDNSNAYGNGTSAHGSDSEQDRLRSRAQAMVAARLHRSRSHAQLSQDAQEMDQLEHGLHDQLEQMRRGIEANDLAMKRILRDDLDLTRLDSFKDMDMDDDDEERRHAREQQMFERGVYVSDEVAAFIDSLPSEMVSSHHTQPPIAASAAYNKSYSSSSPSAGTSKLQRRASYRRSLLLSPTTPIMDMDSMIPPPIPTTERPDSPRSTADIKAEAQRRIEARRELLMTKHQALAPKQPQKAAGAQPRATGSTGSTGLSKEPEEISDEERAAQERLRQAEADARQRLVDMRERREQARQQARKDDEQRKKAAMEAQKKAEQELLEEKRRQEEEAKLREEAAKKEAEAEAARQRQLEEETRRAMEIQQAKADEERQRKARIAAQQAAMEKRRQRQAEITRENEAKQAAADALQRRQQFEQSISEHPSPQPAPASLPSPSPEPPAAAEPTAGTSGYGIDMDDEVDFSTIYRAKALYAYQGVREDDLTLIEDEEIKAHPSHDKNSDWWYGTSLTTGAVGFFPRSYIEITERAFHVQTLYAFEKTREDDMAFGENEILLVQPFQDDNGDWWYGKNEETGESGFFPKSYVETLDPGGAMAEQDAVLSSNAAAATTQAAVVHATMSASTLTSSASQTSLSVPVQDDALARGGVSAPTTPVMKKTTLNVEKHDVTRRRRATSNASSVSVGQASSLSIPVSDIVRPTSPSLTATWASTMDPIELQAIPTDERQRQEAIFELIMTEKSYLRDLQMIVNVFFVDSSKYIQPNEQDVIFSNIDDLLLCNTALLSDLEKRQRECANVVDCVGDIFLQHAESLKCYSTFCRNQSFASRFLQKKRQEDQMFDVFLKTTAQNRPECRSLDLSHFLLQPVQRITRYPLLLKQILKSTSKRHPDYGLVKSALTKASSVLDDVNEETRRFENRQKMSELSRILDMEGYGRLDIPGREFIMEGVLHKAKSGRKLQGYLFSDMFLLLEPLKGLSPKGYLYGLYRDPMNIERLVVRSQSAANTLRSSFNTPGNDSVASRRVASCDKKAIF